MGECVDGTYIPEMPEECDKKIDIRDAEGSEFIEGLSYELNFGALLSANVLLKADKDAVDFINYLFEHKVPVTLKNYRDGTLEVIYIHDC